MKDKKRISSILSQLATTYPTAHIMLTYKTTWELLVAVMLSAQCTDKVVNTVTPLLFLKYPTIASLASAPIYEIEQLIKKTGFYKNKARHIIAAAQLIEHVFNGEVPQTMEQLLTIPGVARKTANVVLANTSDQRVGIAVDTHVIRLSQRLRLVPIDQIGGKQYTFIDTNHKTIDFIKDANPEKIELQLMKVIPKQLWRIFTYQIIDHGRAVCTSRNPHCAQCILSPFCPAKRS